MIHRVLGDRYGWRWWVWAKITRRSVMNWQQPYQPCGCSWYSYSDRSVSGAMVYGLSSEWVIIKIQIWSKQERLVSVIHETGVVVYPKNKSKAKVAS